MHNLKFSVKSLTFSCLICAQKGKTYLLETRKVALNAKSCSKVAEDNRGRPNLEVMYCMFQSYGS